MKKEKVFAEIKRNMKLHKGKYLDEKTALKYYEFCSAVDSDASDAGLRRTIRIAFMDEYGLTEIEAVNILNGYHIRDYVRKYQKQKWLDEMKKLMFKELQVIECPKELNRVQTEVLMDLFTKKWLLERVNELLEAENKKCCINK